jgi:molecular chaperone IbpA
MSNNNSYTLAALDLASLHRHFVGFDQIFEEINRSYNAATKQDNYPPFNILRTSDTQYLIEIAVAGFRESELDVENLTNEYGQLVLTVRGTKASQENTPDYLHRGLASRNFERTFRLNENVEITGATVENGIMTIRLEHRIPETQKPKKVAITFSK